MSHIVSIETKIRDLEALPAACLRLGGELVIGQKQFKWWSHKPGVCDHAVRFRGAKYEIGVVKVAGGYELKYDDYQSGGLQEFVGPKAGLLIQAYAIEKTKLTARRQGKRVIGEHRQADGSIMLRLSA